MSHSWINNLVQSLGHRFVPGPRPPKPNVQLAARLEEAISGTLPENYRYFIGRYGGAILGDSECKVIAPILEPCPWGAWTRPEFFHSFSTDDEDNVLQVWRTYHGRIPDGVFSFTYDGAGNQICLDVAGHFPGSVWFWDHEQVWFADYFSGSLDEAAQELSREGIDVGRFSPQDIVRRWARLHASQFDRPPDYMGMYRMADSFADFLKSLRRVRYELDEESSGGQG